MYTLIIMINISTLQNDTLQNDTLQNSTLPPEIKVKYFQKPFERYYSLIHTFTLQNYYINQEYGITLVHSPQYIYWLLCRTDVMIGLIYHKKIIGIVLGSFKYINFGGLTKDFLEIGFYCIHKKLINDTLLKYLIHCINQTVRNEKCCLFLSKHNDLAGTVCELLKLFIVPINSERLQKINFLEKAISLPLIQEPNPLSFTIRSDTEIIIKKLSNYLDNFNTKRVFDRRFLSDQNYFLSNKNIRYVFVNRIENIPTDFVMVQVMMYHHKEYKITTKVGLLTYYYTETMTLTMLIRYLIHKLKELGFDQLNYYNIMDNDSIDLDEKFTTEENFYLCETQNNNFPRVTEIAYLPNTYF